MECRYLYDADVACRSKDSERGSPVEGIIRVLSLPLALWLVWYS